MAEAMSVTLRAKLVLAALAFGLAISSAAVARAEDEPSCLDASDRARELLSNKQLVEARAQLRLCAASTCDDLVRSICDERLAEVNARLPTVIFDAKSPDGRDLINVRLVIDGRLRSEGALGEELTLDPGAHSFLFEAPGEPPVTRNLVLVEREKGRREHIVLGRALPVTEPHLARPASDPAASPWRVAGWTTIATGALGLGAGTAFGVEAVMKNGDARCDENNFCDDPRARHEARVAANLSTAFVLAGGVLVTAGLAMLIFGPRDAHAPIAVQLVPGPSPTLLTSTRW
jgi:serine/threonine-protein kinase